MKRDIESAFVWILTQISLPTKLVGLFWNPSAFFDFCLAIDESCLKLFL